MSSTGDKIKGVANKAMGNIKQGIGRATNDPQTEAEGIAQERKGEAQQLKGDAKDAIKRGIDKV